MAEHTAEPWEPAPPESVKSVQMSNRDYRRAVACVNACKGIPTERLKEIVATEGMGLMIRFPQETTTPFNVTDE